MCFCRCRFNLADFRLRADFSSSGWCYSVDNERKHAVLCVWWEDGVRWVRLSAGWNCKCTRSALMTPALPHKRFTSTSDDPAGTHCNISPRDACEHTLALSITSSWSSDAVLLELARSPRALVSTDSAENNGGSPWQQEMLLLSIISARLKIITT